MGTKVDIKDIQGKVDFSQNTEPTLNTEQTNTAFGFFDYVIKAINWLKDQLGDKANVDHNHDTTYSKLSFAKIKVGTEYVVASRDSSVELIAGTNVTLTADDTEKTIEIAATGGGGGGIQTVTLASGTDDGTLKLTVDGAAADNIPVKGLGSAAYAATSEFATAAQGTLASNALPSSSYTANDVLSKLLTVDGDSSGLDADTLDAKHASDFADSSQGAKADTALQSIDKTMVEDVLTGFITSHDHNYTTYKIFDDSNGVFDANNIFENVSYYVLNSSNKLNRASLPNGLYGDGNVNNSIISPFWFDSSIIKDSGHINHIKQRIVTSGSSVTGSVDNGLSVISKCYIRVTRGLGVWTPWQRVLTSYDEYNGQSDWNQTNPYQRNYIKNKPDIFAINNEVYNHASLDVITTTGVYPLIYGWEYFKTPNPACGTMPVRSDLEGFLIVYSKDGSISQQIHDTINNIFYIRSFDSQSENWNYWEKIITCKTSYGEQGNSPEVTADGFDLEQEMPVNTFYNIDTSKYRKDLTIHIPLDNVDTYLRNNGPDIGEFKITLMFSSPIDNPTLSFGVSSSSVISNAYIVNGTDPSGHSNISGLEIIIKWYNMIWGIWGFLFSVYKVNIL